MTPSTTLLSPPFPFAALVGQARLQQALLLIAVDPAMGGVLIQGPRGTAKSTSARALAELLPEGRWVTLPLGASEERLIGTLNLEKVLQNGQVDFSPGLLAAAHSGVLYVDEVNLLPDHLMDQLLDVAASGINTVERDGISHQHPARFVLIGTMNPEEGELRPQLLDRFGLALQLANCYDLAQRQQMVKTRLAFDSDPGAFRQRFADAQQALKQRIQHARERLLDVSWTDAVYQRVSEHCIAAQVDGLRADLVMLRAARAQAAWQGDAEVMPAHVDDVAELVLWHRRRNSSDTSRGHPPNPPAAQGYSGTTQTPKAPGGQTIPPFEKRRAGGNSSFDNGADSSSAKEPADSPSAKGPAGAPSNSPSEDFDNPSGEANTEVGDFGALPPQPVDTLPVVLKPRLIEKRGYQPVASTVQARRGHRWQPQRGIPTTAVAPAVTSTVLHWPRTLMAKRHQPLARHHLRFKPHHHPAGVLHCFVLDCSASMVTGQRLAQAKGILWSLLQQAYQQRAEVAVIGFAGTTAQVHVAPTRARCWNEDWVLPIGGGGGTPVTAGVRCAETVLQQAARRHPHQHRQLWLITDGRSHESPPAPLFAHTRWIVDCESQRLRLGRCRHWAMQWPAIYLPLSDLIA